MSNETELFYFNKISVIGFSLLPLFMFFPMLFLCLNYAGYKLVLFFIIWAPATAWATHEYFKALYFVIKNKPVLVLTKSQLIDNFNAISYNWSDIKHIERRNFGSRYLAIKLYEPERYKKMIKNVIARQLYKFDTAIFKTAFTIHYELLKGEEDSNLEFIEKWKDRALKSK